LVSSIRQGCWRSSRSITTNGSTTFYNASGRVTGRSTTSGNQTTIYGSDGRRVGTVTKTKPQGR
jgi:YD repeat-containing protein